MKYCPKCCKEQPPDSFYKASKSKDGLQGYCKSCVRVLSSQRAEYRKAYREKNKEREKAYRSLYKEVNKDKIKASNQIYRDTNREKVRASQVNYKERNKEKVLESSKKYRHKNRPKYAAYASKRRAAERRAQPSWLSKEDLIRIELFWGLRELKSFVTGEEYEVDHIVPLRGVTVCGLHVPWNLRVIPKIENRRKHARYWPDMW